MRIINKDHGIIFFTKLYYFVKLCQITIHRKYSVGYYQLDSFIRMKLELLLKVFHVGMFESIMLSAAQSHSIYYGCMNKPVGYHYILACQYSFKNSRICVHT